MVQKFIKIHFLQIRRSLEDLKIGHFIVLIALFSFYLLPFLAGFFVKKNDALPLVVIGCSSIFYLHAIRKDKRLMAIVTHPIYPIFLAQYLLFISPILAILLWTKNYLYSFALFLFLICISFLNIELYTQKGTSFFSKYLPKYAFEWRSGMRKWGIYIIVFYALALGVSWIRVAPFLALFIGLSFISQFFYSCEPLSILTLSHDRTHTFLKKKISIALLIYSILTLPVVVISSLLVQELWYLGFIFYGVACVNLINFILSKYAYYHPNHNTGGGGMLAQLSLFGSIIPFLAPVPFFLIIWNYFKAKQKLDYYLNA